MTATAKPPVKPRVRRTKPKPIDICENCANEMEESGKLPNNLIELPVRTQRKDLVVRICPHCDAHVMEFLTKGNTESVGAED